MINKVGQNFSIRYQNNTARDFSVKNTSVPYSKSSVNSTVIPFYYPISFTGARRRQAQLSPLETLEYRFTNSASKLAEEAAQIAIKNQNSEITHFHIWKAELNQMEKYMEELDNGTKNAMDADGNNIQAFFETVVTGTLFTDKDIRADLKHIIKESQQEVDTIINNLPKEKQTAGPKLSDEVIRDILNIAEDNDERIFDTTVINSIMVSENENVKHIFENFINKLCKLTMTKNTPLSKRAHLKDYDDKAENVWKNLSLGTNMFVTYDHKKVNPNVFITALYHTKPENITITEFDTSIKERYLFEKLKELAQDKSKKHAVIMYPTNMLVNSANPEDAEQGVFAYSVMFQNYMRNIPPNIKFIMIDPKDNYFACMQNPIIQDLYENFGEISVPVLSTEQFVKAFKEEPLLMKNIKKPFTKRAVEKTVEEAAQLDGYFPDKAVKLMRKMSSYYINKKEITENDVNEYVKETKELFRKNEDDSSINVIFDTGKRLKDIIGKDSTKKEAAAIVKQIKSNHMGTRGMIIYSQDSTAGAGRRFIAKAIAGEAKVPYIEMNAMDFGTKEVDIFGGSMLSPEASVKKVFSLVNTQAESNSNKSVILFIENFEYFSIGELISEYQQKAMAQLLREMDNAERKGLNVLVIGSVSDPCLIGEAAMKSFKFVDSIEVSSPAGNRKERADIIKNTLRENKIKIAGKTAEERENIINSAAKTTEGFPFIYVKNIVRKAQSVALERGHKYVDKSDFTEAYLQITTGRPSTNLIQPHEKRIITSHECGHAVNSEIMNNIAEKYGKPWHKSMKVNFITLDPRGYYGGLTALNNNDNTEYSFENIFSDIVCSYGGHSCEKYFYGIDGSWGISGDLRSATKAADAMIKMMGQGAKTGKQAILNENISSNMRTLIEQDRRVILNNALIISDLITEVYADFNREFTQKYADLAGTGECLVDGDVFREELKDWKSRQSAEKQEEIQIMEEIILDIIDKTKKGIIYNSKKPINII